MKKKSLVVLAICLVFLSYACSNKKTSTDDQKVQNISDKKGGKELSTIKVFYIQDKKDNEITLVTVKRLIDKEANSLEESLKALFMGPTEDEKKLNVKTEIPEGTRLLDISENDSGIHINITNQFQTGGGAASMQMRYIQLFKTIKLIEPVKKIYLKIEGKELKYISGDGLELSHPMQEIDSYIKDYDTKENIQP